MLLQGQYRCFAGYYMIYRLVIITLIIVSSSNDFVFQYLLISASVIIALIHHILKPYDNHLLNVFDGAVLHLLVLVSILPLVEYFDSFNPTLVVGITFILVILPSLSFITMKVITNKSNIKGIIDNCFVKCSQLCLHSKCPKDIPSDNPVLETPYHDYGLVIDDSKRTKATVCTV